MIPAERPFQKSSLELLDVLEQLFPNLEERALIEKDLDLMPDGFFLKYLRDVAEYNKNNNNKRKKKKKLR